MVSFLFGAVNFSVKNHLPIYAGEAFLCDNQV